jgi:hypothetical protein
MKKNNTLQPHTPQENYRNTVTLISVIPFLALVGAGYLAFRKFRPRSAQSVPAA